MYRVYDAALKLKICEEYATNFISYRELSEKYDINLSTVASWIQKYKLTNSIIPSKENSNFYKVTSEDLNQRPKVIGEKDEISLKINGINITASKECLKAIFEVILK